MRKRQKSTTQLAVPRTMVPRLEAQVDHTQGVILPLEVLDFYDPFECYRRGELVHLDFTNLSGKDPTGIEEFVRKYGLPEVGVVVFPGTAYETFVREYGVPLRKVESVLGIPSNLSGVQRFSNEDWRSTIKGRLEPYPLAEFQARVKELRQAAKLWESLESGQPFVGDVLAEILEAPSIRGWKKSDLIEEARHLLSLLMLNHLPKISGSLLPEDGKFNLYFGVPDLLSAMWLMLAYDIAENVRIRTCLRCGAEFRPKRSTKMYCNALCAQAEAQRVYRERVKRRMKTRAKKPNKGRNRHGVTQKR